MSKKPTRRLTGLYKLPDVEEPSDELIDAVAKLLHKQMVEQAELRASTDPDGRTPRSRRTADKDQHPDA